MGGGGRKGSNVVIISFLSFELDPFTRAPFREAVCPGASSVRFDLYLCCIIVV